MEPYTEAQVNIKISETIECRSAFHKFWLLKFFLHNWGNYVIHRICTENLNDWHKHWTSVPSCLQVAVAGGLVPPKNLYAVLTDGSGEAMESEE